MPRKQAIPKDISTRMEKANASKRKNSGQQSIISFIISDIDKPLVRNKNRFYLLKIK